MVICMPQCGDESRHRRFTYVLYRKLGGYVKKCPLRRGEPYVMMWWRDFWKLYIFDYASF